MQHARIFQIWFCLALTAWAFLVADLVDFSFLAAHWFYPAIMVLGGFVAGVTPEGGGAVAFPMLSVFFEVERSMARDFSLMIQSVGMTSASILILSRRQRSLTWYRNLLIYIMISFVGFGLASMVYSYVSLTMIKLVYVSLAFSFIVNFWITRRFGTAKDHDPKNRRDWVLIASACLMGGTASAFFGNGADMLIYIVLSLFWHIQEREGVDISIIVMAAVSILGTATNLWVFDTISQDTYLMWLAAAPIVILVAPLGNLVLQFMPVSVMLSAVIVMCGVNYVYFVSTNPATMALAVLLLAVFIAIFYLIDQSQKVLKYDTTRT